MKCFIRQIAIATIAFNFTPCAHTMDPNLEVYPSGSKAPLWEKLKAQVLEQQKNNSKANTDLMIMMIDCMHRAQRTCTWTFIEYYYQHRYFRPVKITRQSVSHLLAPKGGKSSPLLSLAGIDEAKNCYKTYAIQLDLPAVGRDIVQGLAFGSDLEAYVHFKSPYPPAEPKRVKAKRECVKYKDESEYEEDYEDQNPSMHEESSEYSFNSEDEVKVPHRRKRLRTETKSSDNDPLSIDVLKNSPEIHSPEGNILIAAPEVPQPRQQDYREVYAPMASHGNPYLNSYLYYPEAYPSYLEFDPYIRLGDESSYSATAVDDFYSVGDFTGSQDYKPVPRSPQKALKETTRHNQSDSYSDNFFMGPDQDDLRTIYERWGGFESLDPFQNTTSDSFIDSLFK